MSEAPGWRERFRALKEPRGFGVVLVIAVALPALWAIGATAQDILGTGELASGHYTQVRLTVSSAALYFDTASAGAACAPAIAIPANSSMASQDRCVVLMVRDSPTVRAAPQTRPSAKRRTRSRTTVPPSASGLVERKTPSVRRKSGVVKTSSVGMLGMQYLPLRAIVPPPSHR